MKQFKSLRKIISLAHYLLSLLTICSISEIASLSTLMNKSRKNSIDVLNINPNVEVGAENKMSPQSTVGCTTSPFLPVNLFSVPAIISHTSQTEPGFIFTFLHHGRKHQAVLMETFLTALEKEGAGITWEEASSELILGSKALVDVTQVKPATVEENWLVFGLYLSSNLSKNSTSSIPSSSKSADHADASLGISCLSIEGDPCHVLNETFTYEEEALPSFPPQTKCNHKYEAGAVVVSISSQYLHMVVQLGDTWDSFKVNPMASMVLVDGIRSREVYNIKMGAIGTMVFQNCLQCHINEKKLDNRLVSSMVLLWIGESYGPTVRGSPGIVVGKKDEDRLVVQVEGIDTLVLFYGNTVEQKLDVSTSVLAWAWPKQLRGGKGSFVEGAALVVRDDGQDKDAYDEEIKIEFQKGISSPIRSSSRGEGEMLANDSLGSCEMDSLNGSL